MIIVTSYINPDLDGIGAAIAYAELLRAEGKDAVAAISGTPFVEAQWVLENFQIPCPVALDTVLRPDSEIVLVDTSGEGLLDKRIDRSRVTEVIDHRETADTDHVFVNAKIQIELIGAAATLIAERLAQAGVSPSREAAVTLLGGIISNTMNFSSLNTSHRDEVMRDWLSTVAQVPETFIYDMFQAKTKMILADLAATLRSDGKTVSLLGVPVSQCQLEMVGVASMLETRLDEICSIMKQMKQEGGAKYFLLNIVDLEAKTTDILVCDDESERFYQKSLGITFENQRAHIKGILLRKQMIPLVKKELANYLT